MENDNHHEELISGISRQMKDILDQSSQGVYIYLDDVHKICNSKFASMMAYKGPEEWSKTTDSFLKMVDAGSQDILAESFQKAMEKRIGSNIQVKWKKKNGETLNTEVILVPIEFQDHLMALHFVGEADA